MRAVGRKPQIAKLIADAEAERLAANKITATRTLEDDRRIAFNDPRRFVTADGNLQPITNPVRDQVTMTRRPQYTSGRVDDEDVEQIADDHGEFATKSQGIEGCKDT